MYIYILTYTIYSQLSSVHCQTSVFNDTTMPFIEKSGHFSTTLTNDSNST